MAAPADDRLVLLRYSGEVGTKARATRYQFVRRLLHNLRDALESEGAPPRIRISHDRIYATLPARADPGFLARVFGLQSVSPVERITACDLDAIVSAGVELFGSRVRGRRFAVRARRVGNRTPGAPRTLDIERALGAALLPGAAGVDLSNPEVSARLEVTGDAAYFFPERIPAPGGLPLGCSGRAVALISGGFDSAVAAWQLLRRGVSLDYVFCNLGGATHEQGTLRVAKVLADRWSYGDRPRFHTLDFSALSRDLMDRTATRYWQVLLKRMMLRAAERVAHERRAEAVVTGEAVGQVSSQTLPNLRVISEAARIPVLRPLVGSNKDEIIAAAEHIGTFELSKVVGEYCALVPTRPATAARPGAIAREEDRLDPELLDRAVARRRVIDLRALDLEKLELPDLEIESIPEGAVVLDLRPAREFEAWHVPGAARLDFGEALQAYPSFARDRSYALCCEIGLKSAHLAERMRELGLDAHHVKGGVRALRRRSAQRPD